MWNSFPVALMSEEVDGNVQTFIRAFTLEGKEVMKKELLGKKKFEGIEFL